MDTSPSSSSDFSSDFSDYDGTDSSSESGDNGDGQLGDVGGIEPYQFEPVPDEVAAGAVAVGGVEQPQDDDVDGADDEIDLRNLNNWCTCGNCQVMPTRKECKCRRAVDRYPALLLEEQEETGVPVGCITDHAGFDAVCVNHYVLVTAWYQYKNQYGRKAYEGPRHKKYRHIGYRQLVRWAYGFLGKDIRVDVPSCAACKVRACFPPPGPEDEAQFVGFMEAMEDEAMEVE